MRNENNDIKFALFLFFQNFIDFIYKLIRKIYFIKQTIEIYINNLIINFNNIIGIYKWTFKKFKITQDIQYNEHYSKI